jgi:ParB family chromosome partitioning protein
MCWARRLEDVERLKAKQRMESGGVENFPQGEQGKTRDTVAEQAGFGSGKQYEKAKFIADNADAETIKFNSVLELPSDW